MIKEILTYPNDKDILTKESIDININDIESDEIKNLIVDLKDTLNTSKTGCGISAIQIGVPKKICVIKYNNQEYVLINPVINRTRGNKSFKEGCLSAPGIFTNVSRYEKIWCTYIDEFGNNRELNVGGLCSIIIQHELEHFKGWCAVFDVLKEE